VPDLKNKVRDLGAKVPDPKLEVPDLRSGGIRLNLTPGPWLTLEAAKAVAVSIGGEADSSTATTCFMALLSGTLIDFSWCKTRCLPSLVVSQCA